MTLSLHHMSIRTTDVEATRHFHVDVLGLRVGPRPALPFPGHWQYPGPLTEHANAAVHVIGIDVHDRAGLQHSLGERGAESLQGSGTNAA